jgi:hypothetical protein
MIGLDMVSVSYFGDFLSKGSRESFKQNILFRLSPARKASRPPRKAARPPRKGLQVGRPAAKKSLQAGLPAATKKPAGPAGKPCRPGAHLNAATKVSFFLF